MVSKRPLLIAIVATWCGACTQAKPEIERAKNVLAAKGIQTYIVDADANEQIVKKYDVTSFPTILTRASDGTVEAMPWNGPPTAETIVQFASRVVDTRVAESLPPDTSAGGPGPGAAPQCTGPKCGGGSSAGVDPAFWGPGTWRLIHSVAQAYPIAPTKADKLKTAHFYFSLAEVLPCATCRRDFTYIMKQSPMRLTKEHLASRDALYKWTVAVHDAVNQKLGKK